MREVISEEKGDVKRRGKEKGREGRGGERVSEVMSEGK